MRAVALATLLSAACNQILGIPDPERLPDAPGTCAANPTFTRFDRVGGVNSETLSEQSAWLSPDERTILFTRLVAGTQQDDLYVATRSDAAGEFDAPRRIDELSTDDDEYRASMSDDLTTIYFDRESPTGALQIYVATRDSPDATFGAAELVPGVNSMSTLEPFISADGLYFASTRLGLPRLFLAPSSATGFLEPRPILPEDGRRVGDEGPVVSADGLWLYFASTDATGTSLLDIWVASRSDRARPFTGVQPLASVNTGGKEAPQWISPDGCRLYFTSDRASSRDIWVATRTPL